MGNGLSSAALKMIRDIIAPGSLCGLVDGASEASFSAGGANPDDMAVFIAEIGNLRALRSLSLAGTTLCSKAGTGMKNHRVDIYLPELDNEVVITVDESVNSLELIELLEAVKRHPALTKLNLARTDIGCLFAGADASTSELPALVSSVKGHAGSVLVHALDSTKLVSINLLENDLPVKVARAFAKILHNSLKSEVALLSSLCGNMGNETKLDMSGQKLGVVGAIMLAPEIAASKVLIELDVSDSALTRLPSTKLKPRYKSEGEVRMQMTEDGIPEEDIMAFFGKHPDGAGGKSTMAACEEVRNDPTYDKYIEMLPAAVPVKLHREQELTFLEPKFAGDIVVQIG